MRRRKVKICCIQEVRWKGEGSRALQGYKLIWKGNSEGTAGVGVLVASELAGQVALNDPAQNPHLGNALNDPTPGKRVHSMTPSLKKISFVIKKIENQFKEI